MKNLLFISHTASLTGAPLLLLKIAALLREKNYNVSFIFGEGGPILEKFQQLGKTIVDPLFPDEPKYWREIKRIPKRIKLLKSFKPDLIFCNTIHSAKWLFYAKILNIPSIIYILELSMGFSVLSRLEDFILKHFAKNILVVSDAVKNFLLQKKNINPIYIQTFHASIDTKKFLISGKRNDLRNKYNLENCFVIGTVGRISHMKGTDLYLELAKKLKSMNKIRKGLKFLVVGTKEEERFYNNFIRDLNNYNLTDDVLLFENITNVEDYYTMMDLYVSTAREDPFPLVVLEAMASGKPVAAFAVGGIPESVTEECGILVQNLDINVMAVKIINLINNSSRLQELGKAAQKRVCENYDIVNNIGKIENLLKLAAGKN